MRSSTGMPRAAALSLVAVLSMVGMSRGQALADDGSSAPSPLLAQTATTNFNIPAQNLGTALTAFGRQSGIQVLVDSASVSGKTSTAITGTMTASEALRQLLGGAGIPYRFTSPTAVTVGNGGPAGAGALQLDPVQVQGVFPVPQQAMIDNIPPPYAGGQVATGGQLGLLGNRGVMDTPFNQTSYTAKKIQDQQAQTVRDALSDDPSVRILWPSGGSSGEGMKIRGFDVYAQDVAFGGLFGMLPASSISAEIPERIEVLKGPSAMLSGMPPGSSIGGIVNVVPKRAGEEPLTQLSASYASATQFGGHADIGRRFGSEKQLGVRVNGAFRAGGTSVQRNTDQTGVGTLGIDYRGGRFRLSGDLGYQYQYIGGLVVPQNVAAGVQVPNIYSTNAGIGQPWSYAERKDVYGVVRGEVDLAENVTAYLSLGAHDNRTRTLGGGSGTITNANGNFAQTPANQSFYYTFKTAEAGIRGSVDTGPINHSFGITATTLTQELGNARITAANIASNLYNPVFVARPNIADPTANKISFTQLSGIAVADTLSGANNRVQLTVGARLQQVQATNFNGVSGAVTSYYDQSAFSPSVALVFKPWHNVSIYGNFIQGLQQGITVGAAFTNAGEVFAPYKSTQFEAGVKVDWGKFTTTFNAFQITQPSAIVNAATNVLTLNGEQRNRGMEINFFGEPAEGVRLLGGVMLIDATLVRTAGGLNDGWEAPGVPNVQLNVSGEWDTPFARGLTLLGRAVYTSSQYVNVTRPVGSIPDWARFDLGARYTFEDVRSPTGHPVAIRFNVDNVFDANYWSAVNAGTLIQGSPRTFRLSTSFNF